LIDEATSATRATDRKPKPINPNIENINANVANNNRSTIADLLL